MREFATKMKYDSTPNRLLRAISVVGVVVLSAAIPNLATALAVLLEEETNENPRMTKSAAKAIIKRGLLTIEETAGGFEIRINGKGKQVLGLADLSRPLKMRKLDRKWRLVSFDIPKDEGAVRDSFRMTLKKLGFKQFQKSLWITPYECQSEIMAAKTLYGVGRFVEILEVCSLESNDKWREKFGLK
jgi:DNA-binding transcriptional regulator PaaX